MSLVKFKKSQAPSADSKPGSFAMAVNVRNMSKKKKMAMGGNVDDNKAIYNDEKDLLESQKVTGRPQPQPPSKYDQVRKMMADGGEVPPSDEELENESMAQHIRRTRARKLDFNENDDGMHMEAIKKENYFDGGEINEPREEDSYNSRNKDAEDLIDENSDEDTDTYDRMNMQAAEDSREDDTGESESIASKIRRKRGK